MFLLTTHWFVNFPATTTYLCWLCHSPLADKEDCFVFLLTMVFLSTTVWVFSLTISHGIYLVVPTHPSFFWVVCHLSRTSPPKESEHEPQNRLSLLPTAKPYPLLPLTHDPSLDMAKRVGQVRSIGFIGQTSHESKQVGLRVN